MVTTRQQRQARRIAALVWRVAAAAHVAAAYQWHDAIKHMCVKLRVVSSRAGGSINNKQYRINAYYRGDRRNWRAK